MARAQSIGIRENLNALLPRAEIERLARESGMLRRRRKIDPTAMLWTLALGFGGGRGRSLARLRRAYERASGTALAPSSFQARFTAALVRFLRAALGVLCERLAHEQRLDRGVLARFEDLVVADATVIRLHRLLAARYRGTRTTTAPAAAKLHLVISVLGRGLERVRLTEERANDHRTLRIGPWVRGRLLLFDLGYFRYQLFDCIARNGGYFLTRLPLSANPTIVGVHRRWRGRSIELVGRRLDEVAARLRREELDVEVEVEFRRRVYNGRRRTARRRLRLVGLRDRASGAYWFYLTNIAPEALEANELAQTYACRWAAELAFRMLKSHYGLREVPGRTPATVEALVLASLITLVVSGRLREAIRRRHRREARRVREERWAALFAAAAASILEVVLLPRAAAKVLGARLERMLLHEALDPNASRLSLLERVDHGVAWAH